MASQEMQGRQPDHATFWLWVSISNIDDKSDKNAIFEAARTQTEQDRSFLCESFHANFDAFNSEPVGTVGTTLQILSAALFRVDSRHLWSVASAAPTTI